MLMLLMLLVLLVLLVLVRVTDQVKRLAGREGNIVIAAAATTRIVLQSLLSLLLVRVEEWRLEGDLL